MAVTSGPRPEPAAVPRLSGRQSTAVVAAACVVLAGANALLVALPSGWDVAAALCAAVGVVALGRLRGLTWQQLGLGPGTWGSGLRWGGAVVLVITAGYALTLVVPFARDTTGDLAAPEGANVWVTALLLIPLRTVIVEELTFRGVLWGLIERRSGPRWAWGGTAVAFGCWHVAPALSLAHRTDSAAWSSLVGVLAFTSLAGLLLGALRRQSGSVIAPAMLHWAANGLGLIAAHLA